MIKDYYIKERLGIGAFGVVYKVLKKPDNHIYVIKQIPLAGLTLQQINDAKLEAKILSSVRSNYIVRYYESFEEENNLNIVMEYCDGGDLSQFITKSKKTKYLLKEDLIWIIFLKITIGLATLHKSKILHRDLKPLNIFMTKHLGIKIGDFGVAKFLSKNAFAKTVIGTPYYLSPELCDEKPYNDKSDVWALGCILYELSTYRHPFNAKCQASLVLKILQSQPVPIHKYYSENLQQLINLLLDKNYLTRPSCYEILNLPFVIEKSKKFKLYEKIRLLYAPKKINKRVIYTYSNKTYMNKNRENENKRYIQNTVPIKENNNRNYNKIKSSRYLNSEENHKINNKLKKVKQISQSKNNINSHGRALFVSKTNKSVQKMQFFKENRSNTSERNKNLIKLRIKRNHLINISNLDSMSNLNKKNNIKNISYLNLNDSNINQFKNINKSNNINNQLKNKIKNINSFRSNNVYNSINEFERLLKSKNKNNIKKISVINKPNNKNNKINNISYLNNEDDFLKNIKINDIIDNDNIDSLIKKKINKSSEKLMINIKDFANYLNSYVSKINEPNINNQQKRIIKKNNNSLNKKCNSNIYFSKEKFNIISEPNNNNNNNNNKIIKYTYRNIEKKDLLPFNYSVDVKQNPQLFEKLVVNNIYDNKYNKKNNNNNKIIRKANINIYNNFNNININNLNDLEEKKEQSNNNLQQMKSNIILLYNKNKKLLIKNKNVINRINSEMYSQNSKEKRKVPLYYYIDNQKVRYTNFVTVDNNNLISRKKLILKKQDLKNKENPFKTEVNN